VVETTVVAVHLQFLAAVVAEQQALVVMVLLLEAEAVEMQVEAEMVALQVLQMVVAVDF
jgi:hypothetical protein